MLSRIRAFLYRHRRKFVVTGVVIGGAFLLSKYVRRTLREWQEQQMKEFVDRTRKQQHYESVERTCNNTALTFIPTLKEALAEATNTEALIGKLKEGNCNKVLVWEELKVLTFSKITLLVYTSSLIMVTLRLQLNLIGGYIFKATANDSADAVTSTLQEKYLLAASQSLLQNGMTNLAQLVKEKVEMVLNNRSLKEKLTLHDIEQIFWSINQAITNDPRSPCKNLTRYIVTTNSLASSNIPEPQLPLYQKIIAETRDLLESEDVISQTISCVSRGFTYFVDNVAEYFLDRSVSNGTQPVPKPGSSSTTDAFFAANINDGEAKSVRNISIPMAKVIPIINGLVSSRECKTDIPYTWMQQLILMENLKVLGANVYECFSN